MVEVLSGLMGLFFLLMFYLAPSICANSREHQSVNAIVIVNMLTGWTVIGWVVCWIWALTGTHKQAAQAIAQATEQALQEQRKGVDDDSMACPRCAETIKKAAKICRFCGHELAPG